ncbi:cell division regulator GpsB [Ligilactobacillus faecis]|uniref:Cell division regulator GpsB n=1 Tax=Ligilactobacillus faecis TaxID=762833 RepID=A0ABV4DNJ6_9LACO|nr:cell division regulator GpsB [Ligilactobacillus faecis]WGN88991.1 cell division regulator GpsB [Ligilactobacillus faecis]
MENVNLTPKDIVNKHFTKGLRGYDQNEVDEYLDAVIQDYETYAKEVQRLQMENDRLVSKVDELTKQVAVGNSGQTTRPTTNVANMDVLKRLSNLERHVFGAQLDDESDRSNRF